MGVSPFVILLASRQLLTSCAKERAATPRNRRPNHQSTTRRSPIANRQSVDWQSATGNRQSADIVLVFRRAVIRNLMNEPRRLSFESAPNAPRSRLIRGATGMRISPNPPYDRLGSVAFQLTLVGGRPAAHEVADACE